VTLPARDLAAWLAYQDTLNPRLVDLGLERLRPVAARMGLHRPGPALLSVAGTNGKGSVVVLLEALLRAHGLRTGCYLSPWLLRYNESVRVDGAEVDDAALLDAFAAVEAARAGVALTAFEFRTLAAVHLLRASGVDVLVLEVGLGGRLDAVNLFDAAVSVITTIGLDHREWLGDTLAAVAREKAGIARRGRPLVGCDAASGPLLEPLAREHGARLLLAGRDYAFGDDGDGGGWWFRSAGEELRGLPPPALAGDHQRANAAGALSAFLASGLAPPSPARAARAIAGARLAGRVERLPGPGWRCVDVAHNPQAAGALARWLRAHSPALPLHAVCAMYADKDLPATLAPIVPEAACWYLAPLPAPRGASAERLGSALHAPAGEVRSFESVERAWTAASRAARGARVLAFGSFETVRRVLRLESAGGCLDTADPWTSA